MAKNQAAQAPTVDEAAEMDRYIQEAPIEELAQSQGITLDEAAKLKVERALANAPVPVEVTVRPIVNQGKTLGFAQVNVGGVVIDDFKLVNGKNGVFLAAPSKLNPSGHGFRATVWLQDQSLRDRLNQQAITAYREAIDQLRSRADMAEASLEQAQGDREARPPIKEQMAKAAKAAEQHNAQRPTPEKKLEGRDAR